VLLKLYKYCLRFTAFYTGLFDAVFIQDDFPKDLNLKDTVEIFMLKEGLEAAPDAPTDKVIEILKSVNTKQ
jgi:hypothetical protein